MPACLCGCGDLVTGRFRPGHDAKLKSRLFSAARLGDQDALATITAMGWLHLYDKNVPKPAPQGDTIKAKAASVRAAKRAARPDDDPFDAELEAFKQAKVAAEHEAKCAAARERLAQIDRMKAAAKVLQAAFPTTPRPIQVSRDNVDTILDLGPNPDALLELAT